MTFTFSLLDEAWIPCESKDGTFRELGLRDALVHAHELRGVGSFNPLENTAILRLMLALLHRVFSSESISEWKRQWQTGHWDEETLARYFHQWGDRFNLFHPIHPFCQQRDDRLPPRTVARLFPGVDASTWFNHAVDSHTFSLTPAEAARGLLVAQTFGLPGIRHPQLGLFFNGAPWLTGMVFFVEGSTLFETLMLNWLQYASNHPRPNLDKTDDDRPNWERDDPFTPEREAPVGYLDYLTYPNRRIFFIPVDTPQGVRIYEMVDAPGLKLRVDLFDPFKHYETSQNGYRFLYLNPGKALWRNSSALLGIHSEGRKPVEALNWLAELASLGIVDEHSRFRLMAVGMVSDKAKANLMRMERMTLPVGLLRQEDKVGVLGDMITRADDIRKVLWGALYRLAEQMLALQADQTSGRKPDSKDVKAMLSHWSVESVYWQPLEQPFMRLADELASTVEVDDILSKWQSTLQSAVTLALETAIAQAGDSPQALKAAVLARKQLAVGWKKTFPESSPLKGG